MANEIKMPQLSDTMSSGKIIAWRKNVGDAVKRGEVLAEVETDKANLEIEAFQEGVLLSIEVPANTIAQVGQTIAIMGKAGESIAAGAAQAQIPVSNQPVMTSTAPVARSAATNLPGDAPQTAPSQAGLRLASSSSRIKASPLAKQVARQLNVDLSALKGSGPQGRILRKDVENLGQGGGGSILSSWGTSSAPPAHAAPQAQAAPTRSISPAAPPATTAGSAQLTPLSRMRETIARRMVESVTQSPHFYTTVSVDMRQALKLREHLKQSEEFKGISVNHLVIKAVAYALSQEPRVNCAMRDNQVYQAGQVNVGIITAIEDGLLIPVIRDADKLSLRDLVFEAKAAVERAKAGRPNSTDLTGGTFSISNMGMFDVENFTAIINPGQGAVLAVSATRAVPIVEQGVVVPGLEMKVTLSVDHRIIDGIMAANFLKHFKSALEMPALLTLNT